MSGIYDRQLLLDEVWREPMIAVALRYGLSDVGFKKLCVRLQIPIPGQGHWAKLRAGKQVALPPRLPAYSGNPGDLIRRPLSQEEVTFTSPSEEAQLLDIIAYEQMPTHRIPVPSRIACWHPEVMVTREALKKKYLDRRGMPVPGIHRLNIAVSQAHQVRALQIFDALLKALEIRGYRLAPGVKHPEVELFGVSLAISIFEPATRRDHVPTVAELKRKALTGWDYWPRYDYIPCGRLEIRCEASGVCYIKDTPTQLLEGKLNDVVIRLARCALETLHFRVEQARLSRERASRRNEVMVLKALQDAEKSRVDALVADAARWQQAEMIRSYLKALEDTAKRSGGLSPEQVEFVSWAMFKADWLDPAVRRLDPLVDQVIIMP